MRPLVPVAAAMVLTAMVLVTRPSSGEPRVVDGVVAVVDGNPITLAALRRRAAPFVAQVRRTQGADWEQAEGIRKVFEATLDRMIDDALFAQAARAAGIEVGDSELERTIDRVAASLHMSRAQYLIESLAQGTSEADLRAEFRRQMLEWKLLLSVWGKSHDGPAPSGEADAERRAFAAWRTQWLDIARQNACIERKLSAPAR